MYVYITNESDGTLTFVRDEIASGDYTPDWRPPAVVAPGQRVGFQCEGDLLGVPTSGTEGRVWYNIAGSDGSGGELYIHWNSPLVESQYGNTFHIWAPVGWEVTHSGGQGHHAELEIRVRRTARRGVPDFHATERGLAFTNSWNADLPVISLGFLWNKLFDSLPGPLGELGIGSVVDENWAPITHGNGGLCGGMVYAVMDYYYSQLLPPLQTVAPDSRNDELFKFIRDRLWDSFDIGGEGHRFLGYSSPHYPNGDEGVVQAVGLTRGRSWITYREAWPQIQQDIDAGRLSPVGLIQTDSLDIGNNHQVLAYAYEKSGQDVRLFIYDPNEAKTEVELRFNITHTDGEVRIDRFGGDPENSHRIFCLFRINGYSTATPPKGRPLTSAKKDPASVVWHNSSTNETQLWFMDAAKVTDRATVTGQDGNPALVGPPWRIVGIGDMNGDGQRRHRLAQQLHQRNPALVHGRSQGHRPGDRRRAGRQPRPRRTTLADRRYR